MLGGGPPLMVESFALPVREVIAGHHLPPSPELLDIEVVAEQTRGVPEGTIAGLTPVNEPPGPPPTH